MIEWINFIPADFFGDPRPPGLPYGEWRADFLGVRLISQPKHPDYAWGDEST